MSRLASYYETPQLYFRFVGISLRGQMQYRASFWMLAIGQFLLTGIDFLMIWTLFARFGSLRGWHLEEVALFYGLVNVSFALAEGIGRGFDTFSDLVKTGDFDRLLLRPRSTALQVAAREWQLMRLGRLVQGGIVLGYALLALPSLHTPAACLLLLLVLLGGFCLFYGLLIFQATLSFWTIESLEIVNTVTYGGIETGSYPLTIYRPWFRVFFTVVVPLACVNYLPLSAILSRPELRGIPFWIAWLSPGVCGLFLLAMLRFWQMGVRRYTSAGG